MSATGVPAHRLRVGGLAPLSTCDWPGMLVATVFCQGCPLRCGYCHNPQLRPVRAPAHAAPAPRWHDVLELLRRRRGLLDGVVFSGGEPLAQPALVAAAAQVRREGFAVGLHTAGTHPARLARVLPHVDWVGLDVKGPWDAYGRVTGSTGAGGRARRSLEVLAGSGTPFEVRVTLAPELGTDDLVAAARQVAGFAVGAAALQAVRDPTGGVLRAPQDVGTAAHRAWTEVCGTLVLRS